MQSMFSKLGFAPTLDTLCEKDFPIVSVVLYKEYINIYRTYRWKSFSVEGQGLYIGNTKTSVTGCQLDADSCCPLVD